MSVLDSPPDLAPEIEVFFREARQRRRRRWIGGALAAAVLLALATATVFAVGGSGSGGQGRSPARAGRHPLAPATEPAQTVPAGVGVIGVGPTAIDFSDPDHGWIASSPPGLSTTNDGQDLSMANPAIVRTTDGGASWARTPVPNLAAQRVSWDTHRDVGDLLGIHFADPERGWYFQAGIGWQTNDAGTRWTKMHFPAGGALVALTSSGDDVWALVDRCPIGIVSCLLNSAKGTLYHATSASTLTWHRVGGVLPAGVGALYPSADHGVVVELGAFNYVRSVGRGRERSPTSGCESIGFLRGGELAGVCGGAGGGKASLSRIAVSKDGGKTWQTLLGGPPSTRYFGLPFTNGSNSVFYITGGQTLWRTSTSQPGWRAVLAAPAGSIDLIGPVYISGNRGYAEAINGDAKWYETNDSGVSWQPVATP